MRVIKISDVPEGKRSGGIFTGDVSIKPLITQDIGAKDVTVSIVTFPKGVRNVFHTHEYDQVLYVLSGRGIVADEKQEILVSEGSVIFIPAGERHWHGATSDSEFSHISILKPGQTRS
jgi:quercetin dioxygenase-like cupin family protein